MKFFFSLAFTSSEIKSRSPDAATLARFTVTSTDPEPSSGKVRPANCAATILLMSVNGRSIGTPMRTPPGLGGMMTILAGNGQAGLVCTQGVGGSAPVAGAKGGGGAINAGAPRSPRGGAT